MNKSLLPINATPMERAVETVLARTDHLPTPLAPLWDAQRCPIERLPWLAWALSVDTWQADWPEAIKRRVMANSVQIHRTKGTLAAIERTMRALGVTAVVEEWFEYNGPPFTFKVTAWLHEHPIDASSFFSKTQYQTIQRAIDASKPVRAQYDFQIGTRLHIPLGVVCATQCYPIVHTRMETSVSMRFAPIIMAYVGVITHTTVLIIRMEMT